MRDLMSLERICGTTPVFMMANSALTSLAKRHPVLVRITIHINKKRNHLKEIPRDKNRIPCFDTPEIDVEVDMMAVEQHVCNHKNNHRPAQTAT